MPQWYRDGRIVFDEDGAPPEPWTGVDKAVLAVCGLFGLYLLLQVIRWIV